MSIVERCALDAQVVRFAGPDWFCTRIPTWSEMLAPLRGQPLRALEIGSYEGRSAVWLAQNVLTHPASSLTCIDPCDNGDISVSLRRNIAGAGIGDRASIVVGTSADALPALLVGGSRFDFIYIDGSHVAPDVLADATMAFALLESGGLMAFDDYEWSPGYLDGTPLAPQLAINAFAAVYAERVELIHRGVQAWFRKR